jgi:predicted transcriptional regulator
MHTEIGGAASQDLAQSAEQLHRAMRVCDGRVCLELLTHLAVGSLDVTSLAKATGLELSHLSRLLCQLKRAGLLSCLRDKRRHVYSLHSGVTVLPGRGRVWLLFDSKHTMGFSVCVAQELLGRLAAERGVPLPFALLEQSPPDTRAVLSRAQAAGRVPRTQELTPSSGRDLTGQPR